MSASLAQGRAEAEGLRTSPRPRSRHRHATDTGLIPAAPGKVACGADGAEEGTSWGPWRREGRHAVSARLAGGGGLGVGSDGSSDGSGAWPDLHSSFAAMLDGYASDPAFA